MNSETNFPPQASLVRRTDVTLRAKYPHLVTRIFEIDDHNYAIFFDERQLKASIVESYFHNSLRPASVQIELTNQVPVTFLREIENIRDRELARGLEGFSFSFADIRNILLSHYPDLPLFHSGQNQNNPIAFIFERELTLEQAANVRDFMRGLLPEWPIAITATIPNTQNSTTQKPDNSVLRGAELDIRPARLRPAAPSFVRRDEEFWYNNVDAIFEGRFPPSAMPATSDANAACYLDASAFPQLDLRQAVLLFDTIYLTPPIVDGSAPDNVFWERQALSREDVLLLIEIGRLRLVLTQPEERSDPGFLEEAYERNPSGVIGRLSAAAIMASDIVQTAEEYTLSREDLLPAIGDLALRISNDTGTPFEVALQLLLWPIHARRTCLSSLMSRGLLGIGTFSQGNILSEQLKITTGRDFGLEAHFASDGVHIAHALNATLIPPSEEMRGWLEPRRVVGERLNFYRSLNSRIAAAWVGNERRKERRQRILPPQPLFDFHRRGQIDDLIAITSLNSTRRKGRALITRLSELPIEARNDEIERLAQELYDFGVRRGRRGLIIDNVSDAIDVGTALVEIALPPVRPIWNFLNRALDLARRAPALDRVIDSIEQDFREQFGRNSDLDFLSKISRVAELRENVADDLDAA